MPPDDPLTLFLELFARARETCTTEPTAMVLATTGPDGRPAARYLLLKEADARGFTFYTNLESRKARELRERPEAALVIYWEPLGQQVRVEGRVEPVSDEEADAYFATRPRESQVGAWASRQSAPLSSPEALAAQVAEIEGRFAGGPVPRPPFWSGFCVVPERIEFWTARPGRLHERLLYERREGGWVRSYLFP